MESATSLKPVQFRRPRRRKARQEIFQCPSCGATTESDVVETRATNSIDGKYPIPTKRRRRTCSACGENFTTYEIEIGLLLDLLDGRKATVALIDNIKLLIASFQDREVEIALLEKFIQRRQTDTETLSSLQTLQASLDSLYAKAFMFSEASESSPRESGESLVKFEIGKIYKAHDNGREVWLKVVGRTPKSVFFHIHGRRARRNLCWDKNGCEYAVPFAPNCAGNRTFATDVRTYEK